MTKSEFAGVEAVARRFLLACELLRMQDHADKVERLEHAKDTGNRVYGEPVGSDIFDSPSKHVAAVKRASLDLTRELANLRRRRT